MRAAKQRDFKILEKHWIIQVVELCTRLSQHTKAKPEL